MFDFSPNLNLHYHQAPKTAATLPPVELITGNGIGWTKEVTGNVHVKPVDNRMTLHLQGPGAMKINGTLIIGS
mgnify:CR=1 FL=1